MEDDPPVAEVEPEIETELDSAPVVEPNDTAAIIARLERIEAELTALRESNQQISDENLDALAVIAEAVHEAREQDAEPESNSFWNRRIFGRRD